MLLQRGRFETCEEDWRHKNKHTEEADRENMSQRKTGRAQCKSECVNMYRPNLIIPRPPGPVIRRLIKAGDERKELEDKHGGRREEGD